MLIMYFVKTPFPWCHKLHFKTIKHTFSFNLVSFMSIFIYLFLTFTQVTVWKVCLRFRNQNVSVAWPPPSSHRSTSHPPTSPLHSSERSWSLWQDRVIKYTSRHIQLLIYLLNKMGRYLLGILLLLKYCICGDVVNFDSDIKDFVVGNSKLFVLTEHRLHQMRHDLYEEKRKDITNAPHHNRVNILVPFDANGTLITCGTFKDGYCEVLDINDITNSIYYETSLLVGPRQNEKSVAFIAGKYLLVGKKDDDAKSQDTRYSVVSLWNTLQSQPGGIFSINAEGSDAIIQSTVRDVEFVDGFQRVSPSESYLFLNAETDSERKVLVLWMNNSKEKKIDIIKSLQAATIRCCSDKVRPVLVASTVIPSVNGVIWAGVFSAQNQQDPENSALALYDISNIQGRVKGFCANGEKQCGSEVGNYFT